MALEIGAEYASSLADLTVNSKPLINMLTILAEENQEHAGVIVNAVETHLEKVRPDVKLPVLYLVDSIVKNVGGAYTQKFSQIIVNMFTKTFKQVDEKTRSQMFKLRETWNEVFPTNKLYQLDVKVNLVDPAWPIQAQIPLHTPAANVGSPVAPVIHLNPHFQKKGIATVAPTSTVAATSAEKEEDMMSVLARKQQELLLLQRHKIELQLEATRRQLTQNNTLPNQGLPTGAEVPAALLPAAAPDAVTPASAKLPIQQRLGPPVSVRTSSSATARIAPVSGAMLASTRRADPRLARHHPPAPPAPAAPSSVAPDVFDIKPLERTERVNKRKNVITVEVRPDVPKPNEPKVRELRGPRDPRARLLDPRLKKRQRDMERRNDEELSERMDRDSEPKLHSKTKMAQSIFPVADPKKINKLPPIPRISRAKPPSPVRPIKPVDEPVQVPSPSKRRREAPNSPRVKKPKKKDSSGKGEFVRERKDSSGSSPEKSSRNGPRESKKTREPKPSPVATEPEAELPRPEQPAPELPAPELRAPEQPAPEKAAPEPESKNESDDEEAVAFKELRNSARERNYMRRNRDKSESPERWPAVPIVPDRPSFETEAPTVPDILMDENKDVDLRVFQSQSTVLEPALITRKRPSTEAESKPVKKNKMEKFDILFGDEDVDLRKLPQMDEAPPPPSIQKEISPSREVLESPASPDSSHDKCWAKMKDPKTKSPDESRSQLDLVRAKLAEATKGKDRLGRPLLYNKDEPTALRRRTISSSEDTDMRYAAADNSSENDREAIKIIMSQAEEQLKGGNLNPEQFNLLVMQVLQLNERQKLKEAKQRESLEVSKRKLQKLSSMTSDDETDAPKKPSHDAVTSFGDIDERVLPPRARPSKPLAEHNIPPSQNNVPKDSDLRVPPIGQQFNDFDDSVNHPPFPSNQHSRPLLPVPPMFHNNFPSMWGGPHSRDEFNGPRIRGRGVAPPFFRGRMPFDRSRPPFDPRMPMPPPPIVGISQGECPLEPYVRSVSPPLLGTTDIEIPPTDFAIIDYIDRDPMKTIDIDGVAREIRFYDRTAIVMMDWDDPREITFLPGRRRITFDGKDTFSLNFNEDDIKVNVNGQLLKVGYGKPTRELYVEDKWYECFFGGPPCGIIVAGKVFVIHLAGPPPQVDIGKTKRTDIVAGKINVIVDAVTMSPVFLDAKPQKFEIDGLALTIRFVDSLQTVLINEKPFKVEYGGLPKPIIVNNNKHFIRFSVLPRNVRQGQVTIANMEGRPGRLTIEPVMSTPNLQEENSNETVEKNLDLNAEAENSNPAGGLDMLASMASMPSSMAPASQFSGYSVAEPLKPTPTNTGQIPGLDTPKEETPANTTGGVPFFGSINVNDLFAKLVSTGILPQNQKTEKTEPPSEEKREDVPAPTTPKQITPEKPKQDKKITKVDLLKPETLRVKQGGIVALLYSGMQCSGCGARYPPEQTVIYSQHLDWHFRQNRRERDSARRAHSRNWHYDLSDWIQYEEIEDLEEREKSWFESQGTTGDPEGTAEGPPGAASADEALSVAAGAPADAACALCGDKFDQFYNQDKEEWHLRKAVRHDNNNYHPLCFEDYKASLAKAEAPMDDSVIEVPMEDQSKPEADGADDENSKDPDIEEVIGSDNESVVEVIESESQEEVLSQDEEPSSQATVVEEEDDDDVVLKAEPVEQVDVEDDADTDDETTAARAQRDQLFHINNVRIKQEPIDPDDEPVVTAEAEPERLHANIDTTHAGVTSSIDGNVQLETAAGGQLVLPSGGIRINITKPVAPVASPPSEDSHAAEDCDEPLPPGEEPQIEYTIKPTLRDVEFSRQPPVQRGTELSGLCSIM